VAGQYRFVDDERAVGRSESLDGLEVDVWDRIEDPRIDRADRLLPLEGRQRVRDVVPDDVIRIGRQRRLDVVGVLGREVPIDDLQRSPPLRDAKGKHSTANEQHGRHPHDEGVDVATGPIDGRRATGWRRRWGDPG
jgi:hypothetical protein